MSSSDFRREFLRKGFHLLTLLYLAAFHLFGYPLSAWLLGGWMAAVAAVEHGRLRWPALNGLLLRFFGGITRSDEGRRLSGLYYTCLGCWLTILLFGRHPRAVDGGILFLSLGDASAALAGKAFGRHRIGQGGKTWEGAAACFAACWSVALLVGLPPARAAAAAAAGCVLEVLPVPPNDNFWLPLAGAAALWALS